MNRRRLGTEKEEEAAAFLTAQGYRVLTRNFRCRLGEIDLIAKEEDCLVFVEVKYRSGRGVGLPEEAVDLKKQRTISKVAMYYLMTHVGRTDIPCRFDVVAIDGKEIRLHRNAFPYWGK